MLQSLFLASLCSPLCDSLCSPMSSGTTSKTLTMKIASSTSQKLSRDLNSPFLTKPQRLLFSFTEHHLDQSPWHNHISLSYQLFNVQGSSYGTRLLEIANAQNRGFYQMMQRVTFATEAEAIASDEGPTEAVKKVYDKMLMSAEGRTMPPNAWMWLLIEKCAKREDIALLFQLLQKIRTFRLLNLQIHTNFNPTICLRVVQACTRAGALDFGTWAVRVFIMVE